jgi:hypothetical protein
MDGAVTVIVGVALVALGASGASVLQRRSAGRPRAGGVLGLVPFGVLVGAGAALVRGWDPSVAMVAGAVTVPLVGVLGDVLVAARRSRVRRRTRRVEGREDR